MPLLQILTDPQNFRFYAGGRGHVSNAGSFGQKSIPYGDDTKGGGSSNQPYIKSPIPDALTANPSDYILRGGLLNNVQTSAQDVSRLTQMFTDTKSTNGLFFTLKQQQLSASAVRTQASPRFGLNGQLYSPLNTLAQAGVVSQGVHLNKQGINPFAETGAYANGNENLYGVAVTNRQEPEANRLWQLMNGRLVGNNAQGPDNSAYVMRYNGGPGSFRGVGQTIIRFGKDSKTPLTLAPGSFNFTSNIGSVGQNDWTFSANLIKSVTDNTSGVRPGELAPPITNKNQIQSPKLQDFRKILRANLGANTSNYKQATNSGATPNTPDYQTKNYEQNFNFTDPGQRANKSYANYSRGVIDLSNSNGNEVGAVDKINALPIYRSEQMSDSPITNDFVKFVIAAIDNNDPAFSTYIHFRALLDSFNDSYNANWNATKYLGRGENFYTYDSFTRTVSLSFTVAAQSKQELIPMYKKLNYLASQLTPDYSPTGYMRGPLVKLTLGGYLYEQPGFIQDLTYDMITDAPWEIAINEEGGNDPTVKQLSHMIKVTGLTFIPIHTFVPSKQGLGYIDAQRVTRLVNSEATLIDSNVYGDQRYIALENASNNNYDREVSPELRNALTNIPSLF